MPSPLMLTPENTLPADGLQGTLIGRAWIPGEIPGPSPVLLREDGVYDLAELAPTLAGLLELPALLDHLREPQGRCIASVAELLGNSGSVRNPALPSLLALFLALLFAAGRPG